ncbi:MAG: response regulator, partial [Pedobacter sp.]
KMNVKKEIFILEDNQDLRELYEYILEGENYRITTFATVTAFMEKATHVPDLYLLDVMLPDGNGLDLCVELKNRVSSANVPVILVSAHKQLHEIKATCPSADFIAKPFDIEFLVNKISMNLKEGKVKEL